MERILLHKDVFVPNSDMVAKNINIFQKNCLDSYRISKHLMNHLTAKYKDRSHNYSIEQLYRSVNSLRTKQQEFFEVELTKDFLTFKDNDWHITKYCVRVPSDNNADLVMSIRPEYNEEEQKYNRKSLIVTAWLNQSSDAHYTLDETKYINEQTWKELNK